MIVSFEQFDFLPLLRHLSTSSTDPKEAAAVSTRSTMDLQWSVMWFDGTICEKKGNIAWGSDNAKHLRT
jgi:hypothetical protein